MFINAVVFIGCLLVLLGCFYLFRYLNCPRDKHQLRKKIAECSDVEEQKRLAKRAYVGVKVNKGGVQSVEGGVATVKPDDYQPQKGISLGKTGEVVGFIGDNRFVLETSAGALKVICGDCVNHHLDREYSRKGLPEHNNGGVTIAKGSLSVRDYVGIHLFHMRFTASIPSGWSYVAISLKYPAPACEMLPCKSK